MPVTLLDTIRPIAIAAGVGAGYAVAAPLGKPLAFLSAGVGLVVGVVVLVASQIHAARLSKSRSAGAVRVTSSEIWLGTYLIATLVLLVALPFLASYLVRPALAYF